MEALRQTVEEMWAKDGKRRPTVKCSRQPLQGAYLSTLQSEIDQGGFGIVLTCRRSASQREARRIAQVRNSVVGLIDTTWQVADVLIPVDLSDATLLVLAFVQRFYDPYRYGKLQFIHVLTGTAQTARHRWQYLKKVGDVPAHWRLRLLRSGDNIAKTITDVAEAHHCSTIIMGKRGLSGVKRWLIGSVSAGVLKRLQDKSLVLVD
jgi:2,4-dienoyl-CoA reductase (NADPH2)